MGFDNLTNLYKRTCDFSGKTVISRFRPEIPVKVYDQKIWRSDQRDGLQYGRKIDFTRSFFDQLRELYYDVPKFNVTSNFLLDKNSDYTNYAGSNKNCYFTFGADFNEDCYYDLYIK